jgi:hypothetical protein
MIIQPLAKTLSNANAIKGHYNSQFWQTVRKQAKAKLANATRENGTLIWDKLPNIFSTSPKLEKNPDGQEYLANAFYGAPSWASLFNTCATATFGCATNCLNESGHGQLHMINKGVHHVHVARMVRTLIWFKYRDQFKAKAQSEIHALQRKAARMGVPLALRPNGTTDLRFESLWPELFSGNPNIMFWDYTKDMNRNVDSIPNYSLCYSVHENTTESDIEQAFANGMNCVVVGRLKRNDSKPTQYMGRPTVDGDKHDLRFLDPTGHFVLLFAKGGAYSDTTGFVRDVKQMEVVQ